MKKILIILILFGFLIPNFSFGQEQSQINLPETLEGAKKIGEKALEVGEKELPGIIEKIWKGEVLPIWQKMWNWFKAKIWTKIENWLKPEIEKRKQFFKEGLEQEKKEMKGELKTEVPSWWEKFKELIK